MLLFVVCCRGEKKEDGGVGGAVWRRTDCDTSAVDMTHPGKIMRSSEGVEVRLYCTVLYCTLQVMRRALWPGTGTERDGGRKASSK